jgi:diaminopimelate decarboxylase
MVWNTSALRHELRTAASAYKQAFSSPDTTVVNCAAVKANPFLPLMDIVAEEGFGFESASRGEMEQSLAVRNIDRRLLVFDSPTKTRAEIVYALESNVHVNIDNFQELRVLDQVLTEAGLLKQETADNNTRRIGVRVNPEIGGGSIDTHSTSEPWSKFGIGVHQYQDDLIQAFKTRPYLRMLHWYVYCRESDCVRVLVIV